MKRLSTHSFENADGHALSAILHRPVDDEPVAWALFAHCFTCGKDLRSARELCNSLAGKGIATLRFDFTGLGASEGEFASTGFSSQVSDLHAAARFMAETWQAPQLVIGHSLGGAAVLRAAPEIESVRAVVTIGAPSDPAHVGHLFANDEAEIRATGEAIVSIAGRPFPVRAAFLDDIAEVPMQGAIESLGRQKKALLVLHAPLDDVVGIDHARRIFQLARHPKSFISLDGADHLLSRAVDARYAGSVIATWALRYLVADPEHSRDRLDTRGAEVVVRTGADHFRTDIRAGGHAVLADEPQALGGTDLGPSPYDLLLAALGACTSITLRMYADRKKWPLDEAFVRLTHRKIHARDCDDCESDKGRVDVIDRRIELTGQLTDEQRTRLLQIADRCPVHKTLHNEIKVLTKAEPASSRVGRHPG